MTTLTQQRIKELLDDINRYEQALRANEDEPTDLVAMAWTVAKAKLTALKGNEMGEQRSARNYKGESK